MGAEVSKELLLELEREKLLRGVPLQVALSGWAKHWSGSQGLLDVDKGLYNLSQQTEDAV
ncbi:ABCF5 [Symbiodinium pilosum]|uniref:ABCF5 protein n=1 Tax=Symbiodinium pilosum TaxID=2952 RepID=A0A812W4M8_SYMPI|nr:ABCF5 [Symbiodinium pilosum]